jgi:hypothetical protein
MKKNITILAISIILISLFSFADITQAAANPGPLLEEGSTFNDLVIRIVSYIRLLIPLLIGAAVIVFLYGVFIFIAKSSAGNAESRKEGVNFMIQTPANTINYLSAQYVKDKFGVDIALTVHDSVIALFPENKAEEYKVEVALAMQECAKIVYSDYVPFTVDSAIGKSWGDAE